MLIYENICIDRQTDKCGEQGSCEDEAAALSQEELKKSLYRAKRLPGGATFNFIPLATEHFDQ